MARPEVRIGLLYGLINGGIGLLNSVFTLAGVAHLGWVEILSSVAQFLVSVLFYVLAGRAAAVQTGSIRSAALAGLLTALVSGAIGLVNVGVQLLVDPSVFAPMQNSVTHSRLPTGIAIAASAIGALWGLAIALAIGAGLGALGGLLGRRAAQPVG